MIDPHAHAVVRGEVERVSLGRGRAELARPARADVVAAVRRDEPVRPVESDLGVDPHPCVPFLSMSGEKKGDIYFPVFVFRFSAPG